MFVKEYTCPSLKHLAVQSHDSYPVISNLQQLERLVLTDNSEVPVPDNDVMNFWMDRIENDMPKLTSVTITDDMYNGNNSVLENFKIRSKSIEEIHLTYEKNNYKERLLGLNVQCFERRQLPVPQPQFSLLLIQIA